MAGLKKAAGILFGIGVVLLLFSAYVALVYHGDIGAGASWVIGLTFQTWIITFFILLLLLAVVLLVLLLLGQQPAREPEPEAELDITCENCTRSYVVTDTGDRPLYHSCPYCGHSDAYDEEADVVEAEPEEELVPGTIRETPTGERELILRCSNCRHVFPTAYTDERPLYAFCPKCGKKGVLTEPAPDAEGGGGGLDDEDSESESETNVAPVDEDDWDESSSGA